MATYVPTALRQQITERARGRCEYCHFPQYASLLSFEIEHIIAEKHGGTTTADNLALACPFCNRNKGTDLGSLDPKTGKLTPFFHPRQQHWARHFRVNQGRIMSLTAIGRVTAVILQFNPPRRLAERQRLFAVGLYP